jgi:hypothetical protein
MRLGAPLRDCQGRGPKPNEFAACGLAAKIYHFKKGWARKDQFPSLDENRDIR